MADLLEKIGKYFAAQELQTRQTYAAEYAPNQQAQNQRVSVATRVLEQPQRPMKQLPPSLVRRRLPIPSEVVAVPDLPPQRIPAAQKPRETGDTAAKIPERDLSWGRTFGNNQEDDTHTVAHWDASRPASSDPVQPKSSDSQSQLQDSGASVSSSRRPKRPSQRHKLKRRASVSSRSLVNETRLAEQKAEKVAAALVLAQERARRIQLEELQQQQAKQEARDAQRSRIQEQMRRIEAIRIKNKPPVTPQSTRPSSAPSVTRSSSLSSPMLPRSRHEEADASELSTDNDATVLSQRGFLRSMEEVLRRQMLVDLQIKQELIQDQHRRQLEMARLQARTLRQRDRNDKQQKTIETLGQNKAALENELAQLLEQSSAIASQRRRMEEMERQERIRRQKEAERRLNAQLREEERQRLMDQERTSSEIAAEARAKASQRLISRATAAQKPTPYCCRTRQSVSSRPSVGNNSRDKLRSSSGSKTWFPTPEISEFEEDGLGEETSYEWDFEPADDDDQAASDVPMLQRHSPASIGSFQWQVPQFVSKEQFDDLLLNDMLSSSDEGA